MRKLFHAHRLWRAAASSSPLWSCLMFHHHHIYIYSLDDEDVVIRSSVYRHPSRFAFPLLYTLRERKKRWLGKRATRVQCPTRSIKTLASSSTILTSISSVRYKCNASRRGIGLAVFGNSSLTALIDCLPHLTSRTSFAINRWSEKYEIFFLR